MVGRWDIGLTYTITYSIIQECEYQYHNALLPSPGLASHDLVLSTCHIGISSYKHLSPASLTYPTSSPLITQLLGQSPAPFFVAFTLLADVNFFSRFFVSLTLPSHNWLLVASTPRASHTHCTVSTHSSTHSSMTQHHAMIPTMLSAVMPCPYL